MGNMNLVFTPAVAAIQEREGSRRAYAKSDWPAASGSRSGAAPRRSTIRR